MKFVCSFFLVLTAWTASAQDPAGVDIIRDAWGVPHIFAKTDAGVAYGLAWANSEDDFKTIQQGFLAGKTMLGRYNGKQGATIDFIVKFLGCREAVDKLYDSAISPQFKAVLQGYCNGFNAYAKAHRKQVLVRKLFPVTPKDMLTYSVLELTIFSGADEALKNMVTGTLPLADLHSAGSNAYAFNSKITADGHTYLAINSHQPLQGPVAWYEAHVCSEEGWNILGALFPGTPCILHGCNENLGWAHTVNNPDKLDTYQLEVDPQHPLQYKMDGEWLTLEEKTIRLKVKLGGFLTIGVSKKIHRSVYGPTMITKNGTFAIRTGALVDIRPLEQWYRMNKAKNFSEFRRALDMNAINGFNIVYADRHDTIYYLSNAKLPIRNPRFRWNTTLPGNTTATLWTQFHPVSDLPQLLQPSSGYLFNSNHSPFNASSATDNLRIKNDDPTMGFEHNENNRSLRFMELMKDQSKISYADFKRIKYDQQLPAKLAYKPSGDSVFSITEAAHPELADVIRILASWDRKANIESTGATVFDVIYYKVTEEQAAGATYTYLTKSKSVDLLGYANTYLQTHFGKVDVPLGEYQKLVRGETAIPLAGIPDVISAMRSVPWKNGKVKGEQGESYIELVDFGPKGPVIETINCFGASNDPDSPHYTDQMEMFTHQKTKPMTLNKSVVYREAKRIYHPE